ncbi:MAG: hypothetical protein MUF71_01290 [Candidatus Kapabacteria bacterium]|jgi:hypothetical protein|nr:hypothetical protein [Candidatus Kapabacteria bacterium]
MPYTTFPAQIRQHRIVLDSAVELPENGDVLIVVLGNEHRQQLSKEHQDLEQERNDWYAIAAQSLERAYSDDEPDYSNVPLIEVNPLYRYANQNPQTSTKDGK